MHLFVMSGDYTPEVLRISNTYKSLTILILLADVLKMFIGRIMKKIVISYFL